MEPSDLLFADEFDVFQEYAALVFDVRRAAVSLPFQVHRLKVLVEDGLVAFSSACFELRAKFQKKRSTAALRTFRRFFLAIFTAFIRLLLWGSARRCLFASSLCCHAAFISASKPRVAYRMRYQFGRKQYFGEIKNELFF